MRIRLAASAVAACVKLFFGLLLLSGVQAAETPASFGEPATVDTPIFRIPMTKKPPTIDGAVSPEEWEDASALSAFWYDYGNGDFRFLAPIQTQLQVYAAYDKENLYIACHACLPRKLMAQGARAFPRRGQPPPLWPAVGRPPGAGDEAL